MKTFQIETQIVYSQVVLFNNTIEYPFSNWSDTHVNQGFVWREGTISFGSLDESDDSLINFILRKTNDFEWDIDSKIQIALPFHVLSTIEFGSLFETVEVDLPNALYQIYFEAKEVNNRGIYNITFVQNSNPISIVNCLEDGRNPPVNLLMDGEPAI